MTGQMGVVAQLQEAEISPFFGIARADSTGTIQTTDLFSERWLPDVGSSIFETAAFLGAESDMDSLRIEADSSISIAGLKPAPGIERIDIRVIWHRADQQFLIFSSKSCLDTPYHVKALQELRSARILEEKISVQARMIAESSRLLAALVKRVPAAIAMFDTDLCYLHASEQWERQIGFSGLGKPLRIDNIRLEKNFRKALPDLVGVETWHELIVIRGSGKGQRWLSFGLCPWHDQDGACGGLIAIVEDKTTEIAERRGLKQANLDLRQFSLAVSHDLRAPVRQLSALSVFLREDHDMELGEAGRVLTSHIHSCSIRLELMLEGLLQLIRLPLVRKRHVAVDVDACIAAACATLKSEVEQSGFLVEVETLPPIQGDPVLLELMFQNLLQNSLKYGMSDKPVFFIRKGEKAEAVTILVGDHGPGIPLEKSERAFQLFEQLGQRGKPGAGVGLALCKRIMELHGGKIQIVEQEKPGLTMLLTFPARINRARPSFKKSQAYRAPPI